MIVNRKNTFSGLKYSDDPAIMAWELANEPRPGPDGADGERNIEYPSSYRQNIKVKMINEYLSSKIILF